MSITLLVPPGCVTKLKEGNDRFAIFAWVVTILSSVNVPVSRVSAFIRTKLLLPATWLNEIIFEFKNDMLHVAKLLVRTYGDCTDRTLAVLVVKDPHCRFEDTNTLPFRDMFDSPKFNIEKTDNWLLEMVK